MINGEIVYVGGHSGLKIQVYKGGLIEVVNGSGQLVIACSVLLVMEVDMFVGVVDVLRGYPMGNAERSMIKVAVEQARRAL